MLNKNDHEQQLKVAYYLRVSTEDQVERFGIDLQRNSLDSILKAKGKLFDGRDSMVLAGERYVYKDEGISGTIPLLERPAFARLLEDIENAPHDDKPFDIVAVYKIDRFARRLKILVEVIDKFDIAGIKLISAHESIDTTTPFGRAILGIVGVLSELEMETIKQRTLDGRLEAANRGVIMGNNATYGYTKNENKQFQVFITEAEVVKNIFHMFVNERRNIIEICGILEDRKILSPGESAVRNIKRKGNINKKSNPYFWTPLNIKSILRNEIYIGKYYYNKTKNKKIVPKDEWLLSAFQHDAIIDDLTFFKAQSLLGERIVSVKAKRKDYTGHTYLLTGLLKCNCCYDSDRDKDRQSWHGEPKEIGKGSNKYTHYYKCRRKNVGRTSIRCKALPLPADQIEEYVVTQILELINKPHVVFNHQKKLKSLELETKYFGEEIKALENKILAVPNRKKNLQEQHEHGHINIKDLNIALIKADEDLKRYANQAIELRAKISLSINEQGYLKTFEVFKKHYKKTLEDLKANREEVKRVLQMIVDKIIIYSRPVTAKDIIAGKRTDSQQIPNKIELVLKLPQDYLKALKDEVDKTTIRVIKPTLVHPDDITPEEYARDGVNPIEYKKQWAEQFGDENLKW